MIEPIFSKDKYVRLKIQSSRLNSPSIGARPWRDVLACGCDAPTDLSVTRLATQLMSSRRDAGTNKLKPIESVTKPGVSKSAPPIASANPSAISCVGTRLDSSALRPRSNMLNPCTRSSVVPSAAVSKISMTVIRTPIAEPT